MTTPTTREGWEERFDLVIAQSAPFTLMGRYQDADFERIKSFFRSELSSLMEEGDKSYYKGLEDGKKAERERILNILPMMKQNDKGWNACVKQITVYLREYGQDILRKRGEL